MLQLALARRATTGHLAGIPAARSKILSVVTAVVAHPAIAPAHAMGTLVISGTKCTASRATNLRMPMAAIAPVVIAALQKSCRNATRKGVTDTRTWLLLIVTRLLLSHFVARSHICIHRCSVAVVTTGRCTTSSTIVPPLKAITIVTARVVCAMRTPTNATLTAMDYHVTIGWTLGIHVITLKQPSAADAADALVTIPLR